MNIREITDTIEEGNSLKQLTQAYGEVALIKIRKIRSGIEQNRLFFKEIASIFKIIKQYGAKNPVKITKSKGTISLLLSSNFRFYGNIDSAVIRQFLETTPKFATDRLVIGKTGDEYLNSMNYFNSYTKLQFEKDIPALTEIQNLVLQIKDYNKVLIFYPQFVSIFIQNPTLFDLTQSAQIETISSTSQTGQYTIFEPELEKIISFFDSSIISMLLQQTFFEAELARTASRILAMDEAQINAGKFIDSQKTLMAINRRTLENTRMLENFASFVSLRKEGYG